MEATPFALTWEPDVSRHAATTRLPQLSEPSGTERSWMTSEVQRRAAVVAGVAIAVTGGTVIDAVRQAPQYEGAFQLKVQPRESSVTEVPTPQIQDRNQPLSSPKVDTDTQMRVLKSQRVLEPVVASLQQQGENLSYRDLSDRLSIQANLDQTLTVGYRDADPARVRQVLEQVAQQYEAYGQECRDSACQGVAFIEQQVPRVRGRIESLQTQIQQFNQQNGLTDLDMQTRIFSNRAAEIARQKAEISVKQAQVLDQYSSLQTRMALKPDQGVSQALLRQDTQYQSTLNQFRTLNQQIASEFSRLQGGAALPTLYAEHQRLLDQLQVESQSVVQRYLANAPATARNPFFKNPDTLGLLQQSIGAVQYLDILDARQQMLTRSESLMAQERQRLAVLLRQYDTLRQNLQTETTLLSEYLNRLDTLQSQVAQTAPALQVTQPPTLDTNAQGVPVATTADLGQAIALGTLAGGVLGVGAAAFLERRRAIAKALQQSPHSMVGTEPFYLLEPAHNADVQQTVAEVWQDEKMKVIVPVSVSAA